MVITLQARVPSRHPSIEFHRGNGRRIEEGLQRRLSRAGFVEQPAYGRATVGTPDRHDDVEGLIDVRRPSWEAGNLFCTEDSRETH